MVSLLSEQNMECALTNNAADVLWEEWLQWFCYEVHIVHTKNIFTVKSTLFPEHHMWWDHLFYAMTAHSMCRQLHVYTICKHKLIKLVASLLCLKIVSSKSISTHQYSKHLDVISDSYFSPPGTCATAASNSNIIFISKLTVITLCPCNFENVHTLNRAHLFVYGSPLENKDNTTWSRVTQLRISFKQFSKAIVQLRACSYDGRGVVEAHATDKVCKVWFCWWRPDTRLNFAHTSSVMWPL